MSGKHCFYSACLAVFLGAAAIAAAEQVYEIDMREDTSVEGRYVLFCSLYERDGGMTGDAFVVLAKGENSKHLKIERAFGLHLVDGKMTFGPLTAAQVNAVRNADGVNASRALIVKVDEAQYTFANESIERWAKCDSYDYSISVENTDMSEEIVRDLGLYPPYRKAWDPINPIRYFVDLGKLNRNM